MGVTRGRARSLSLAETQAIKRCIWERTNHGSLTCSCVDRNKLATSPGNPIQDSGCAMVSQATDVIKVNGTNWSSSTGYWIDLVQRVRIIRNHDSIEHILRRYEFQGIKGGGAGIANQSPLPCCWIDTQELIDIGYTVENICRRVIGKSTNPIKSYRTDDGHFSCQENCMSPVRWHWGKLSRGMIEENGNEGNSVDVEC